ncbi:lytic murein transglycosylase [Hyphobacterium sp.]|uniref:lytic murein transglycosylase n=1 Tax=Hyphobacterium sp. TaxID=2004662 RepID=UPI003B52E982
MTRFIIVLICALWPVMAEAQDDGFADWLADFRPRLVDSGASPETVAAMLDGLEPDLTVVERDRDQPEFVRPLWQYLDIAASDLRVRNGAEQISTHNGMLAAIEERFGVDYEILVAIWGLESSYGAIQGDRDIVRSLATLAWEGRRRRWAEAQLLAVARMIDNGYANRDELRGSWAGAMGQTQFIPETYLARGADFDGDGRIDIWNNVGDALASSANLLSQAGWSRNAPIVIEIVLPETFDLTSWDPNGARMTAEWSMRGIRRADGADWQADTLMQASRLVLPAGRRGPAFLTFPNFRALMRYNNSTSYGIGVWLLSRRFSGEFAIRGEWPDDDPPINRSQTLALQQGLLDLGFDPGAPDGLFGPNTRRALMGFQRDNGYPVDGYAGRVMYDQVMAAISAAADD